MVDKYKIIFLIKPSGLFLEHFWIFKLKSSGLFFLEHFGLDFID